MRLRRICYTLVLCAMCSSVAGAELERLPDNLLPDGSFEEVENGVPVGWEWTPGRAKSTLTVDKTIYHSGQRSVKIVNTAPRGPHIYCRLICPVALEPGHTYTLSCYFRSADPGLTWLRRGWDPSRVARFWATGEQWQQLVATFKAGEDEEEQSIVILSESPTAGLWVDDIQLVKGPKPLPVLTPSGDEQVLFLMDFVELPPVYHRGREITPHWNQRKFSRRHYTFAGAKSRVQGLLYVANDLSTSQLDSQVTTADGRVLGRESHTGPLEAGTYLVSLANQLSQQRGGDIRLDVRFQGMLPDSGETVGAEVKAHRCLITSADAEVMLQQVEWLQDRLTQRVKALRVAGRDPAYPLVTLTILENFVGYAHEDVEHGEIARAYDAVRQMEKMAREALKRDYLPPVPRYATAQQGRSFRIEGPALLGTVRWPDGHLETNRPLQFVGHGHFGQVRRDMEKFPGYGINLIQIEIGPRILTSETEVNYEKIDSLLRVLDRAAQTGVGVNLLLSPHYFPEWALKKWPFLRDCHGGFFRYCIHAPESRSVLERFLRILIPRIANHPALHSLCLSNEPVSTHLQKCRYLPALWHDWLRREHGTIQQLNERWGSDYASFADIPVLAAGFRPDPIYYDFIRCNQEVFAGFHEWMAKVIREMAPDIPLHAKIMIGAAMGRSTGGTWSVSPLLFARFSDFNGNDCGNVYQRRGEWASGWRGPNMRYDFQRSMADKPIFNSENHIIRDRNLDFIPPQHITNLYWQEAIHGQSSTTTWMWERTYSHTHDFAGSIMHRPACTEAMGHVALDLMRLAPEVDAFQRKRPQVVLLWSLASVMPGEQHIAAMEQVYEGLNFSGVRLGFVTERQLNEYAATGEVPLPLREAKVVIVPQARRAPEATITGLRRFVQRGGKVVFVGDCFREDEYGHRRPQVDLIAEQCKLPETSQDVLTWAENRFSDWGIERRVVVRTADGQLPWGVEYLAVAYDGRWLVNLSNYHRRSQQVQILLDGQPIGGQDLISGQPVPAICEVPMLRPLLVSLAQ